MADPRSSSPSAPASLLDDEGAENPPEDSRAPTVATLDWLLTEADDPSAPRVAYPAGLHSAELLQQENRRVLVRLSQEPDPRWLPAAEYVESPLLELAQQNRQRVLVESDGRGHLCVVGLLQTRLPEVNQMRGRIIEIDATESLTLRSGRAGMRLRADGDVELVGSKISAASRGLLRLVGRALRLN